MIYVDPVPVELASGHYYDQTAAEYYLSPAKLESDYAPVRFERELAIFRKHCTSGAVLDVGCSTGAFLWQLSQRFPASYEIVGTDASGPALEYASSHGLAVIRGNFIEHDFEGKKYDAVTFWAVLEHLLAPGLFLQKAASILKSGGLCFVLVPNMKSLAVRLLGARYRYIYPQHFNYFTEETLSRLVGKDFSIVNRGTTHFNPLVISQDWLGAGREVSNSERGALLKRTTAYKQNPWLAPVRTCYRCAEQALGAMSLADNLVMVLRLNLRAG